MRLCITGTELQQDKGLAETFVILAARKTHVETRHHDVREQKCPTHCVTLGNLGRVFAFLHNIHLNSALAIKTSTSTSTRLSKMCHLKIVRCSTCSSTHEVQETCPQQEVYDRECGAHDTTQADDQHPERWVEQCQQSTVSRPFIAGLASSTFANNSPDTRLDQTIFQTRPSWIEEYGNLQVEPPDLYDPDLEREEPYFNDGGRWTQAETHVLQQWPDRAIPFRVKSLVVQGVTGTLRTLMQLERKYRTLTGVRFASYNYLRSLRIEPDDGSHVSDMWSRREVSILRYVYQKTGNWGERVKLYCEKTGTHRYRSSMEQEAAASLPPVVEPFS